MNRLLNVRGSGMSGWFGPLGLAALLAVVGWTASGSRAWAQEEKPAKAEEKLPKAEDVLDKAIEAVGGKAAMEKVHNRVTKGTVEISPQGLKGTLTVTEAAPNKRYVLFELEGGIKEESGTDGEVFWQIAQGGPRILEGEERSLNAREAVFNGELQWRKLYKKAECVGIEDVDDKPCYKIVMTPEDGRPETRYYDRKSYLLQKMEMTIKTGMGDLLVKTTYADYKKVDGLLFPHKATQDAGGIQQMVITMTSITHDADLPADRFALPAAVKALAEKSKAESKPAASEKSKPEKP